MIKIIVVDDDIEMQNNVRQIIRKVIFNCENEIKINNYTRFDGNLMNEIKETSYHKIYILDIELANNSSGIQIAKKIREIDWDSQIIFMTNHDKMFETVYRSVYQVFDFIEKFHDFELRLENDLKTILTKKFDNKMFCYNGKNIDLQVYFRSILYIYRDANERKVILVTDSNRFVVGMTINEILEKLDDRFMLVHRSCIANSEHIQKVDWVNKKFILDNGNEVSKLSKKYKKEIDKVWKKK